MSRTALKASLAIWLRRHAYRQAKLNKARKAGDMKRAAKWQKLLEHAGVKIRQRRAQLKPKPTLASRALGEATKLIGVMEVGGNNRGPMVTQIIRANGGPGPEPWCGDLQAFVYRKAGSKVVQRAWAAVRSIGFLTGMSVTRKPVPGDLVCFTFDHVGMFVKDNGNGTIQTIEGNTGRSGALSDSRTGGDGVYRKVRSKHLVSRYVHVSR